jgi:hypothetical protein
VCGAGGKCADRIQLTNLLTSNLWRRGAECCLCQGLKEKLSALWEIGSLFQNSLTGAKLEVRDITTNSAWLQKYQHEIPVLAR